MEIAHDDLRNNLIYFLKDIIVHAKSLGILMCIHPDDPPISLFGLPRIVSNEEDFEFIFKRVPEINNGITFCTGSLGVIKENNLAKIFNKFASRVHFIPFKKYKKRFKR
jgi:mannonate dehydratase